MENKLQLLESGQLEKLSTLSEHQIALFKTIGEVNSLVSFKLEIEDLLAWTLDLERLRPHTTKEELAWLIDQFKTGEIVWDRNQGIQNLFVNLKKIVKENGVYRLLKPIW